MRTVKTIIQLCLAFFEVYVGFSTFRPFNRRVAAPSYIDPGAQPLLEVSNDDDA